MNEILRKKILRPKNKDELIQFIKEEIKIHGDNCDLNHIDISLVNDLTFLFSKIPQFNGDISQWNTSKVETMSSMFENSQFNNDISAWNVGNVMQMNSMFSFSQFNQDISNWKTSKVFNMSSMFQGSQFNQDISQWDTSNVLDMSFMFSHSLFNQDISRWNTYSVTTMYAIFKNSKITKIPQWNYFKTTNIQKCFDDCFELTESLPDWYQFNHITNAKNRQKSYDDYLKSKKFNHFISNNLIIKNKSINKI